MLDELRSYFIRLQNSLLAIIKVVVLSRPFSTKKSLKKDSAECVILGNGPSLSKLVKEHGSFVEGKDVFCVNYFPVSELYISIKPGYLIIAAPEIWKEDVDENYIKYSRKLFEAVNEKTKWPLKLYIPFAARKNKEWKKPVKEHEFVEIIYYNDTGIEGFKAFNQFLFRNNLAMPRPHNVLIPSIFLAINLQYKNVFLWGAENNQFLELVVNEENIALLRQQHFYDSGKVNAKPMTKVGKERRYLHEILNKFRLTFIGYQELSIYAKSRNVKIYNQTPDSMIDAFERKGFD